MTNLPRLRVLLVGVVASVVMPLGLAVPSGAVPGPASAPAPAATVGNPQLQSLLDELVSNGASGALARLDDGRHTWRLFNYTEDEAWLRKAMADPTAPWTPQQLIAVANAHPPTFPPGAGWSYTNTGYIVVGLMLEAVTGRPLERLVRQRIIRPLG